MYTEFSSCQPSSYIICVKGRLDLKWEDWFDGFAITYADDNTILKGAVPDQAALHGILGKINDLGLFLISINNIPERKEVNP